MIISLSDFNNLSEKDKKITLENLKRNMGVMGIIKEWNISRSKAYRMMRELSIPVNKKASRPSNAKMNNTSIENKNHQANNKSNTSSASNPQIDELLGSSDEPLLQGSTITAMNDSAKIQLYIETQGSLSMVNEVLKSLLELVRLTDSNVKVNRRPRKHFTN